MTVTRAAELLGFGEAAEWLRAEGLVAVAVIGKGKNTRRVERVVWRQVLARLEQSVHVEPVAQPARKTYHRAADV